MSLPFFQVDAFSSKPFGGNPAAVVLLDRERSDDWLQSVAMENNLSETAYVLPMKDGLFSLRWFTPSIEVDLCGHATLAAAHALWESETVTGDQAITFQTRSGRLSVRKNNNQIQMNFPVTPLTPTEPPDGLLSSFQAAGQPLNATAVLMSAYDYIIVVKDEASVRSLTVDFRQLANIQVRGVAVTAGADLASAYDFVSRFFAPAAGVDEDPVTGSAHCALIDYWSRELNSNKLTGYQASARGGIVKIEKQEDRAILTGDAVTVIRGTLLVDDKS